MADWVWTIIDSGTGKPIPNAEVSVRVDTTPLAFGDFIHTTGPGYNIDQYSDASGTVRTTISYTCKQNITGTIKASGYNDQPFEYGSGFITGDVFFKIQMSALSLNPPPGQGAAATITTGGGEALSNLVGGTEDFVKGLGVEAAVVVVAAVIGLVALAVLLGRPAVPG